MEELDRMREEKRKRQEEEKLAKRRERQAKAEARRKEVQKRLQTVAKAKVSPPRNRPNQSIISTESLPKSNNDFGLAVSGIAASQVKRQPKRDMNMPSLSSKKEYLASLRNAFGPVDNSSMRKPCSSNDGPLSSRNTSEKKSTGGKGRGGSADPRLGSTASPTKLPTLGKAFSENKTNYSSGSQWHLAAESLLNSNTGVKKAQSEQVQVNNRRKEDSPVEKLDQRQQPLSGKSRISGNNHFRNRRENRQKDDHDKPRQRTMSPIAAKAPSESFQRPHSPIRSISSVRNTEAAKTPKERKHSEQTDTDQHSALGAQPVGDIFSAWDVDNSVNESIGSHPGKETEASWSRSCTEDLVVDPQGSPSSTNPALHILAGANAEEDLKLQPLRNDGQLMDLKARQTASAYKIQSCFKNLLERSTTQDSIAHGSEDEVDGELESGKKQVDLPGTTVHTNTENNSAAACGDNELNVTEKHNEEVPVEVIHTCSGQSCIENILFDAQSFTCSPNPALYTLAGVKHDEKPQHQVHHNDEQARNLKARQTASAYKIQSCFKNLLEKSTNQNSIPDGTEGQGGDELKSGHKHADEIASASLPETTDHTNTGHGSAAATKQCRGDELNVADERLQSHSEHQPNGSKLKPEGTTMKQQPYFEDQTNTDGSQYWTTDENNQKDDFVSGNTGARDHSSSECCYKTPGANVHEKALQLHARKIQALAKGYLERKHQEEKKRATKAEIARNIEYLEVLSNRRHKLSGKPVEQPVIKPFSGKGHTLTATSQEQAVRPATKPSLEETRRKRAELFAQKFGQQKKRTHSSHDIMGKEVHSTVQREISTDRRREFYQNKYGDGCPQKVTELQKKGDHITESHHSESQTPSNSERSFSPIHCSANTDNCDHEKNMESSELEQDPHLRHSPIVNAEGDRVRMVSDVSENLEVEKTPQVSPVSTMFQEQIDYNPPNQWGNSSNFYGLSAVEGSSSGHISSAITTTGQEHGGNCQEERGNEQDCVVEAEPVINSLEPPHGDLKSSGETNARKCSDGEDACDFPESSNAAQTMWIDETRGIDDKYQKDDEYRAGVQNHRLNMKSHECANEDDEVAETQDQFKYGVSSDEQRDNLFSESNVESRKCQTHRGGNDQGSDSLENSTDATRNSIFNDTTNTQIEDSLDAPGISQSPIEEDSLTGGWVSSQKRNSEALDYSQDSLQ